MSLNIEELSGYCPVQGSGYFDSIPFYFRARGSSWSLNVGIERVTVVKEYFGIYSEDDPYAAGWMQLEEATTLIEKCYKAWSQTDIPHIWYKIEERIPKIIPGNAVILFNSSVASDQTLPCYPYVFVDPAWIHRMGIEELQHLGYTHWMMVDNPNNIGAHLIHYMKND